MAETKVEQKVLETITLEELMQSEEKLEWRIDGFLPKGCIAVVSGISGVKRSFFLEQMALALATGEDFLHYSVPNKSHVLMYEAELSKGELKGRAARMLTIYPTTEDLLFNNKYSLKLDKNVGALIYTMEELKIDVAILDPLYLMHSGNINDEQNAMTFLNPLESYCLEKSKNIIFAAHSTKVSEYVKGKVQNRGASGGAVKGTSAQVQVAAYVWTLSDSFATSNDGKLTFEKTRDIPRPEDLSLKFRDDTYTFIPSVIPDEKRLEWLKRKNPQSREEAMAKVSKWFDLGRTKAYALTKDFNYN